jgi:hypothetical protein
MNKKMFYTGLGMQALFILGILLLVSLPFLSNISVAKLLAYSMIGIFEIAAISFMLWGAFKDG